MLDRTPIAGEPNGVSWGGYAGLSLRLVPALRPWQFSDSEGPVKEVTKQARWIAFSGPAKDGQSAAIVVLEHPTSFRHPTPWYLIQGMPYFSPAVLYRSPYTLPAKQSPDAEVPHPAASPAARIGMRSKRQWQAFASAGELR